ncbi:MAG: DUF4838 domain-containing protein, partial [Clostridia bacterium]|nr:DUF4838 domain-containing protein [Clostridia bacterium]
MKKTISLILCAVLALGCMLPAFAADGGVSVDGTWSILIPAEPTSYESFAAGKLQSGLSEVFGTEIAIVSEPAGSYIAVGAASAIDPVGIADNGYRIKVIDGNIHLRGAGVRGLQVGAYRLLEEFFGRKVYTSTVTVLPTAQSVSVPADADISYAPFFEYADTDWRSPCNTEYSMANGLNGGTYRGIPAEMGGTVNYLGGFCHTMGGLCETAAHAETNPEQLALHDGERTTDQPCLTEPAVLEIATRNVLNIAAARHDPNASVQIISVTQNDNYNYCECDRCKAFEA